VLQVRANQAYRASVALPSRRLEDLSVLIRRQQESDRSLADAIAALEAKQRQIEAAQAEGRNLDSATRRDLAEYRTALGLTPLQGPGVVITLSSDPKRLSVPQAQDIASVVNELWAAGAEAAAVNGIRVLATDGFVPLPRGVRIVGRPVLDPYAIAAIGDAAALEGALLARGGAVDGLRGVGIGVTLTRVARLVLPAYAGQVRFRFARPASGP
jgi:uncharacterized protein YlxW (UPF0749 family)